MGHIEDPADILRYVHSVRGVACSPEHMGDPLLDPFPILGGRRGIHVKGRGLAASPGWSGGSALRFISRSLTITSAPQSRSKINRSVCCSLAPAGDRQRSEAALIRPEVAIARSRPAPSVEARCPRRDSQRTSAACGHERRRGCAARPIASSRRRAVLAARLVRRSSGSCIAYGGVFVAARAGHPSVSPTLRGDGRGLAGRRSAVVVDRTQRPL
jgi:hypothetical protein